MADFDSATGQNHPLATLHLDYPVKGGGAGQDFYVACTCGMTFFHPMEADGASAMQLEHVDAELGDASTMQDLGVFEEKRGLLAARRAAQALGLTAEGTENGVHWEEVQDKITDIMWLAGALGELDDAIDENTDLSADTLMERAMFIYHDERGDTNA